MFRKKMDYGIEMVDKEGKTITWDPNFYYGCKCRGRIPNIGEKIEVHLGDLFNSKTKNVYMTVKDILTPLEGLPKIVVEASELKNEPFVPKIYTES